MTTTHLPPCTLSFDYLIVGGGTSGCVIASRLASYLPSATILLVEGGPSDFMNDKVLKLKDWLGLLGGELDYDYGTTVQVNGGFGVSISVGRGGRARVDGNGWGRWKGLMGSVVRGARRWAWRSGGQHKAGSELVTVGSGRVRSQ